MRQKLTLSLLAIVMAMEVAPAQAVLSPTAIPATFNALLKVPALSNPAMILIDETTGEIIYERSSLSQRKPASVMKLLAATAALEYLEPNSSFATKIFLGKKSKTLIIEGSLDPWMSYSEAVAKKNHRISISRIGFASMKALRAANHGSLRNVTVAYSSLYSDNIVNLKSFWSQRGFYPKMKPVDPSALDSLKAASVSTFNSPTVAEIIKFTLLWSDNLLAERLARLASKAAGNEFNDKGVATTFTQLLTHFNIDSSKLVIADASGLSKKNRITAQILGQLLIKTRKDEKFAQLYNSLPVGGISGTLKNRFITTAPTAVGLVHAKTGTLNGTVTLAGYVESGDREYVFVTLADEISGGVRAENIARAAIDRILGRIAAPIVRAQAPTPTK